MKTKFNSAAAVISFVTVIAAISIGTGCAAEPPETVLVTFHVKSGKADELNELLARSWTTYERLGLVLPQPHIIARSTEGETTFFELFSWKRNGIPDSAPAEVRELWDQMEALCEPRAGQSGIDFVEVDLVRGARE